MRKLEQPYKRVILARLGVPIRQQPKTLGELDRLYTAFRSDNPEGWQEAYNSVVLNVLPTAVTTQDQTSADMGELIREHVLTYQASALTQMVADTKSEKASLTSHYNRLGQELASAAKDSVEKMVAEARNSFVTHKIQINDRPATTVEGVLHEKFPRMLQLAGARKHILLVGPSGSGKTHVAKQIADHLSLPFHSQSCAMGVSESQFTGRLIPIAAGGAFEYDPAPLIECYEKGGVFLFDELDNSDPNVLVFVNQLLANDSFTLAIRRGNTTVKRHPDFVAIGAANTWGTGATAMYTARQQIDASTLDRFKMGQVLIDYSPTVESHLCSTEVLAWGQRVRAMIGANNMRKIMSTRFMRDATDMIQQCGWGIREVEESYFADWSPEEMRVAKMEGLGENL